MEVIRFIFLIFSIIVAVSALVEDVNIRDADGLNAQTNKFFNMLLSEAQQMTAE